MRIALHMLEGAAYLQRVNELKLQSESLSTELASYRSSVMSFAIIHD